MSGAVGRLDAHHVVVLDHERRHQERDVHFAAAPGGGSAQQRRRDPERERHRAHVIDHWVLAARGHAVLDVAARRHEPAARLHDQVHAGESRRRTAAAERADVADHETRMARRQARPVQAQLGRQAGAEVREHDVGAGQEAVDDAPGRRMAEVERQRMLAPVPGDEVARLAGRQRRQLAHRVAVDRLHLDDVSAALRQNLGAEGNRDELAELDHLDAGERARIVHSALG